jgi:hypothetical protein
VLTNVSCCCFVVALSPRGGRHMSKMRSVGAFF